MFRRLPFHAVRPSTRARALPLPGSAGSVRFASLQRSTGTSRPYRFAATAFAIGTGALVLAYYYDSRSVAHEHVVMPIIRALAGAEDGHKLAVKILSLPEWARPKDRGVDGPELRAEVSVVGV